MKYYIMGAQVNNLKLTFLKRIFNFERILYFRVIALESPVEKKGVTPRFLKINLFPIN